MSMPTKNSLEDLSFQLWNFIHDYQVGNISDMQVDMPEGIAIHNIIDAAETIVKHKVDLFKILNNIE
jgi:hypothetical protein